MNVKDALMLKKVPLWAWIALSFVALAILAWWLTGDSRALGGSGLVATAPRLAKGWKDRAERLRARAAVEEGVDVGAVLDSAEAEGMRSGMKAEADQW